MTKRSRKVFFPRKRPNYERELKKEQLTKYLLNELRSCSTHGLPHIMNKELHWYGRAFWFVSFLLCTVLVFVLLTAQYTRFIEAPTVMSVEMDYFNWNVSYPAITLCPIFKPDRITFSKIIEETNEKYGHKLDGLLWTITFANLNSLNKIKLKMDSDIDNVIDPREYTDILYRGFMKCRSNQLTTNTNLEVNVDIAMTENGLCHVLNSNVAKFENPANWNSNVSYAKSNIQLSLYESDFFTQIMNYSDVYAIYIHSPDDTILISTPSITYTEVGFHSIGVSVWSTKISETLSVAPISLRKCRYIHEPISKRFPVYTYNYCMIECRIQMIKKLCGCVPHFYKPLENERVCLIVELQCVLKFISDIRPVSASTATLKLFPHKNLPKSPKDCGCLSNCETDTYQKDYDSFLSQSSMNRLRIGISTFPKVRVVRDIIFDFYDIVLRSGGVVNLCIGTSIISLFELFLIFFRIPVYWIDQVLGKLKIRK